MKFSFAERDHWDAVLFLAVCVGDFIDIFALYREIDFFDRGLRKFTAQKNELLESQPKE